MLLITVHCLHSLDLFYFMSSNTFWSKLLKSLILLFCRSIIQSLVTQTGPKQFIALTAIFTSLWALWSLQSQKCSFQSKSLHIFILAECLILMQSLVCRVAVAIQVPSNSSWLTYFIVSGCVCTHTAQVYHFPPRRPLLELID